MKKCLSTWGYGSKFLSEKIICRDLTLLTLKTTVYSVIQGSLVSKQTLNSTAPLHNKKVLKGLSSPLPCLEVLVQSKFQAKVSEVSRCFQHGRSWKVWQET